MGVSPRLPESKLSLLPGFRVVRCNAPMRLGIFSDVHANYEALSAVLQSYRSERIDVYYCLGDTVGYGGLPQKYAPVLTVSAPPKTLWKHSAAAAAVTGCSSPT